MKNKTSLFILLILLVIAFVLTASIYGIRDFGDSSNTDESNPLLEWIEKMDTTDKDFTEYAGDYPEDEFIITDDTEEHSTTEESESETESEVSTTVEIESETEEIESETESNAVEDTASETEEDGWGSDLVVDTDPDKDEDYYKDLLESLGDSEDWQGEVEWHEDGKGAEGGGDYSDIRLNNTSDDDSSSSKDSDYYEDLLGSLSGEKWQGEVEWHEDGKGTEGPGYDLGIDLN